MADLKLRDELLNDPLAWGYSGMTDQQCANQLNSEATGRTVNRKTMLATEVYNAVDEAEFVALSADQKQEIWDIVHMGEVNPFGLEAQRFTSIFGGGSNTITLLASLRLRTVSRAVELGIYPSYVKPGHVAEARA